MLRDLKQILDRQEQLEAGDFKAAAKQLLARQFLLRERQSDRQSWRLVVNYYDYFENLFDALGWTLHRDDEFGLVGILPGEQESYARLKLVETLFLLVIRLLYEEGMDRFETQDGSIFISSHTLLERYENLFKRTLPSKTTFRETLGRFKQHGILEIGDEDSDGVPELKIFPTIRLVTGAEAQRRVSEYCQVSSASPDEEDDESNIENNGGNDA